MEMREMRGKIELHEAVRLVLNEFEAYNEALHIGYVFRKVRTLYFFWGDS